MSAVSRKRNHDKNGTENDIKKHKGHWSMGLLNSLDDPELFVQSGDLVTVIKDRYPKAEIHYLVVPKENISSLKVVTKKHLSLLKHMDDVARKLCEMDDCEGKQFKIGYHAEPSMVRLHLHVISDDMNSPCVKTKKHWNSFNTDFFLESEAICNELEEKGKIELPSSEKCKEYMNIALKCSKCSFLPKHMPDLKWHLLTHTQTTD